ncbi:hypothetical protein IGI04_028079 [Brassica rapa subsp. trilocularis]|uniref:Uncharacterized protein n=1 Tax=Brassica rapa subsp. trilocularis TaxID=1813537 RepID=A0ABQ7L0X7_BRACM|nr:hypothetical protein IGI04_028079 [Brassica rapa subsp. trilocularis]
MFPQTAIAAFIPPTWVKLINHKLIPEFQKSIPLVVLAKIERSRGKSEEGEKLPYWGCDLARLASTHRFW